MMVTSSGTISAEIKNSISRPAPANRKRASAYPARDEITSVSSVTLPEIYSELKYCRAKG